MAVNDCSCYDEETGMLILALVNNCEKTPETCKIDPKALKEFKTQIKTCGLDAMQGKNGRSSGGNGDKPKRKLSEYQVFMGSCMKPKDKGGEGKPMTECVVKWREKKHG